MRVGSHDTDRRVEKYTQNCDQKPERNRPLRKPRRRLEDNIKLDIRKTGWKIVELIHLAQDSDWWRVFVNTIMRTLQKAGNILTC